MTPCFYCGRPMIIHRETHKPGSGPKPQNMKTVDHVIPQWMLRKIDRLPADIFELNKVLACLSCNNYKGNLSPLDWLVIMPSNEGATRLGELLMRMGCTIDEVAEAMGRRKK